MVLLSFNKPLESYYNLFNCSKEELNRFSKKQFKKNGCLLFTVI